jgi:hypothetical protein
MNSDLNSLPPLVIMIVMMWFLQGHHWNVVSLPLF